MTFLSLGLVPKSQLMRLVILSSPRSTSRKSWLSELRGMVMTGASISTSSSSRKPTPAWSLFLPAGFPGFCSVQHNMKDSVQASPKACYDLIVIPSASHQRSLARTTQADYCSFCCKKQACQRWGASSEGVAMPAQLEEDWRHLQSQASPEAAAAWPATG